ncbi:MAG: aromatic-L-amino-acid/L-tryptophan decarboxylase [Nocardioidaceae bacterium]|nr:aromatic-L-amino-acid/L-tryptophan decarboxylase [Nocardioidaceae bacterium]
MADDPLDVDAETMRRLGYQAVDWLVDRATHRRGEPVLRTLPPNQMADRLSGAAPAGGEDFAALLDELGTDVLPFRSRIDHPRYLAYVPGEGTWPGALGDLIASAYNIDVGNWMESAGPSRLELVVLGWFADWIGYPHAAAGVLVSGGSAANLTALACARESMAGAMSDDLVVYVSDQGHSSLARAARLLGFGPRQVRVMPVDHRFRLRVDALDAAIAADLAAGRRPLAVLAVAGTTNTGAVDDLPAVAAVCRRQGVWLHVDGAYGGFASITARGRAALAGLELADSVTLDPHKWLYQPFEVGALLVRDGRLLRKAFEIHPDYLQDSMVVDREVNFADHGLQLTRMSRALKVWLSIRFFGIDAFRAAVDSAMDLTEHAERYIESSDELELLSPAALGIVCFRRRPATETDERRLESLNAALVTALADSGLGLVSSTRLTGRYALRACILNHSTTAADVEQVLGWLEMAPIPPTPPPSGRRPVSSKTADVTAGWPVPSADFRAAIRSLPLLSGVDDTWLDWVASVGRRRRIEAGATVVRQWDVDRDFYLLLAGDAEVLSGERHLATMHAGDFFGELAALDWGASFGYPRLATIRARSDLTLLVLTDAELAELMEAVPEVSARIRATAGRRASRI